MDEKNNIILVNKELLEEKDVFISRNDRGYQFGDGVYEVIKIYNGEMFTSKEHIERLYESARKIQLTIPYKDDELTGMLKELMMINKLKDGHIYLQITRGVAERIHQFPENDTEAVLTAYTKEMDRPLEKQSKGIKVTLVEDERWFKCDIKSLNLLANVLAKQEATVKGSYEAILHRGETVTEGSASNVFGIKDGILYTHPATNRILHGITRKVVLEIADLNGLVIKEEAMTVEELLQMDELFLTSTTSEIMPITQVDEQLINEGEVGRWTKGLQREFERLVREL